MAVPAKTVRWLATRKKLAKVSARKITLAGGDNAAEGLFGTMRQTMRRFGGTRSGKDRWNSINALSGAALVRRAGLDAILEAHRQYRMALDLGHVVLPARDAYRVESLHWLPANLDTEAAED